MLAPPLRARKPLPGIVLGGLGGTDLAGQDVPEGRENLVQPLVVHCLVQVLQQMGGGVSVVARLGQDRTRRMA